MQLLAIFNNEDDLLKAIDLIKEKEYDIEEVYTPYPIHEVFEKLERKTRITYAAYFYGLFAVIAILSGLYYTSVIDWSLNIGGKPSATIPPYVVVVLIGTILTVTIASLITFNVRAKIYPHKQPNIIDKRITNDKFVIEFYEKNKRNRAVLEKLLKQNAAEEVIISNKK